MSGTRNHFACFTGSLFGPIDFTHYCGIGANFNYDVFVICHRIGNNLRRTLG